VTGDSKELLESEVKPLIEVFMQERGLVLSQEKTVITHITEGFDFLGQHVRKNGDTLLITPSKKNIHTFLENVRAIVRRNKQATAGHLIVQLNPVIRGWAQYHRHVASKQTYHSVDASIFAILWHWARRRHPNKGARWVRHKYFHTQGNRHWVFSGEVAGAKGETQRVWLFATSLMPITRHVQVRDGANPYDPAWEVYFEERLGVKMERTLLGRNRLRHLWMEQHGLCPVCRQKITTLTGWHAHHIVWRSKGGQDGSENRVLLHPTCHKQVHSQGRTVVKPRPAQGDREA
jgi:RNA-directed DNA polymerase